MVSIDNPVLNTQIFAGLLGLAIIFSLRKRKDKQLFPISVTQELKGFAIMFIVFAHIGYSLSDDSRFMTPLSYLSGTGVDIFLFLSGFGLTISSLKRTLNPWQFYKRRLSKLFIPLWIILGVFLLLDFLVLHRTYPGEYLIHSFLGIFKSADVTNDIDSPLWYFTAILFYYIIYPLVFIKKFPWLSAIIIFSSTYILLYHSKIGLWDNSDFYVVHTAGFPLGIMSAWIYFHKSMVKVWLQKSIKVISSFINLNPPKKLKHKKLIIQIFYWLVLIGLIGAVIYSRIYSEPDDTPLKEQTINILTVFALIMFFAIKRFEMKLFFIFGLYSYEIYLLHWPLISRYDIFYLWTPPWLATVLYLAVFVGFGWLLQNSGKVVKLAKTYKH